MLARFLIIISLFLALPIWAQDLDRRLLELSAQIDDAKRLAQSGNGLDMDELSLLAHQLENILREMRQVERSYGQEREILEAQFHEESKELTNILGFMSSFEAQSAPHYILHPQGALASVQTNIIMESLLASLESEISEISKQMLVWRKFQEKEEELKDSAMRAFDEVNALRENIIANTDAREPKRQTREPMVLDSLFAVSNNLNHFVSGLDNIDMIGEAPKAYSVAKSKEAQKFPVRGKAVPFRDGVNIDTSDHFILSPFPATVRFQADFLDYGEMIILEPEKDYLLVVSGLDHPLVKEGDVINKDDIIGFFSTNPQENGNDDASSLLLAKKTLYLELRYKTVPVRPMDYFDPREE